MIDLGVNIDHVATVRQARRASYPDPVEAALLAERAGADLITLHLREDRRHIQDADVHRMKPLLMTRMNLECAVTQEMVDIALQVRPHDVCLVPERREEVTTEGGLDVRTHFAAVQKATEQLKAAGIRISHFIDADIDQVSAAHDAGATVVELHTGAYAHGWVDAASEHSAPVQTQLTRIAKAVEHGNSLGLRVNAGHGLTQLNVQPIARLQGIAELNIGHAIIADSIFVGLEQAIKQFKALMIAARTGA